MNLIERIIAATIAATLAIGTLTTAHNTKQTAERLSESLYNQDAIIEILNDIDETTTIDIILEVLK